jgi:hypothetical protein
MCGSAKQADYQPEDQRQAENERRLEKEKREEGEQRNRSTTFEEYLQHCHNLSRPLRVETPDYFCYHQPLSMFIERLYGYWLVWTLAEIFYRP